MVDGCLFVGVSGQFSAAVVLFVCAVVVAVVVGRTNAWSDKN